LTPRVTCTRWWSSRRQRCPDLPPFAPNRRLVDLVCALSGAARSAVALGSRRGVANLWGLGLLDLAPLLAEPDDDEGRDCNDRDDGHHVAS
jgi:hypothetical protein